MSALAKVEQCWPGLERDIEKMDGEPHEKAALLCVPESTWCAIDRILRARFAITAVGGSG